MHKTTLANTSFIAVKRSGREKKQKRFDLHNILFYFSAIGFHARQYCHDSCGRLNSPSRGCHLSGRRILARRDDGFRDAGQCFSFFLSFFIYIYNLFAELRRTGTWKKKKNVVSRLKFLFDRKFVQYYMYIQVFSVSGDFENSNRNGYKEIRYAKYIMCCTQTTGVANGKGFRVKPLYH